MTGQDWTPPELDATADVAAFDAGFDDLTPAEDARLAERIRAGQVHRLAAADLAAAGYEVAVTWESADALEAAVDQAEVEARAAAERAQTVEVACSRCGHGWGRHWAPDMACAQGMRDGADCSCPGFGWVDPQGPAHTYGGGQ